MTASPDIPEPLYETLRRLSASFLRRERADHTLQPTALANEVFLRFAAGDFHPETDRETLIFAMTTLIREVLVDHARRKLALKRGGDRKRMGSDLIHALSGASPEMGYEEIVAVHEAIDRLHFRSPRQARLVELRFFCGLSLDEAAVAVGTSPRTAATDWRIARAFLRETLHERSDPA